MSSPVHIRCLPSHGHIQARGGLPPDGVAAEPADTDQQEDGGGGQHEPARWGDSGGRHINNAAQEAGPPSAGNQPVAQGFPQQPGMW